GRCLAPCDGRTDSERYGELVRWLASSLSPGPSAGTSAGPSAGPGELLEALERRMSRLADARRVEEAASVRDRLHALAEGLRRARSDAWLIGAGHLELRPDRGSPLRFDRGALLGSDGLDESPGPAPHGALPEALPQPLTMPCPRERVEELAAVRSWVARHRPRVEACDEPPAEPVAGGATLQRVLTTTRAASRGVPNGRRSRRR
ncbi:MAG TPA: hypothetical protein VNC60_04910, partial [Actinomycetota bacterium]|nr:hypothetical protein [Actinomycetota bacterium]